jgi:hypothetical protein
VLEQAKSDILILIDSCAAGTANTDEGHGVTELVAAGGFNDTANGVGPCSFTHALVIELGLLSNGRPFTISKLHNRIVSRMQNQIPDEAEHHEIFGSRPRERLVTPIHVVLTEDQLCISRRIQLLPRNRCLPMHSETLEFIQISQSIPTQESSSDTPTPAGPAIHPSILYFASKEPENLPPKLTPEASAYEVKSTPNQPPLGQSTLYLEQVSLDSAKSLLLEMERSLQELENGHNSELAIKTLDLGIKSSEDELQTILRLMKTQIKVAYPLEVLRMGLILGQSLY